MNFFNSEFLDTLIEYIINTIVAVIIYLLLSWIIKINKYDKWISDILFIIIFWFCMYRDWRSLIKRIIQCFN